jgi:hypothetical protein
LPLNSFIAIVAGGGLCLIMVMTTTHMFEIVLTREMYANTSGRRDIRLLGLSSSQQAAK